MTKAEFFQLCRTSTKRNERPLRIAQREGRGGMRSIELEGRWVSPGGVVLNYKVLGAYRWRRYGYERTAQDARRLKAFAKFQKWLADYARTGDVGQ